MVKGLGDIVRAGFLATVLLAGMPALEGCTNNVWNTRRPSPGAILAVSATANALNAKTAREAKAWAVAAEYGRMEATRDAAREAASEFERSEPRVVVVTGGDRRDEREETREYPVMTLQLIRGQVYRGEVLNGKPHGTGRLQYPDGGFYEGEFRNGLCEGFGKWIDSEGNIWEGMCHNDKLEGVWTVNLRSGVKETRHYIGDKQVSKEEYEKLRKAERR